MSVARTKHVVSWTSSAQRRNRSAKPRPDKNVALGVLPVDPHQNDFIIFKGERGRLVNR
jgi:hypothetical protein